MQLHAALSTGQQLQPEIVDVFEPWLLFVLFRVSRGGIEPKPGVLSGSPALGPSNRDMLHIVAERHVTCVQVLTASGALEDAAWSSDGAEPSGGLGAAELAVGNTAAPPGSTWSTQTLTGADSEPSADSAQGNGTSPEDKEEIKRTLSAVFQPLHAGCAVLPTNRVHKEMKLHVIQRIRSLQRFR